LLYVIEFLAGSHALISTKYHECELSVNGSERLRLNSPVFKSGGDTGGCSGSRRAYGREQVTCLPPASVESMNFLTSSTTWHQTYYVFGRGLGLSAMVAALPAFTLLYLLGVRRKSAWSAAVSALLVAFIVAAGLYGMPVATAISAASAGAAFGVFPISWIVFWAIALYQVTVETGRFEIIQNSIGSLSSDRRIQALLIGFAFGAFVEGAAGFGTPVAVAAAMLTGLGFSSFDAAAVCLLANTAPVAFGSIGIPVITLAGITGLPIQTLSSAVGRICAPVSLILPAYLTMATAGVVALKKIWPAAAVAGATFAGVQLLASHHVGPQLTDILASIAALAALLVLVHAWRPIASEQAALVGAAPRGYASDTSVAIHARGPNGRVNGGCLTAPRYSRRELFMAWMPYGLLVVFVLVWGWKATQALLDAPTISFPWPSLHNVVQKMPPLVKGPVPFAAVFHFNWLSASGTACMFATVISAMLLGMRPLAFAKLLLRVARQLVYPTVTVAAVLGLAFLLNYCGAMGTLGLALASTGRFFPFFSPLLGWLGVFVTGSDTSANALFGSLQVVTAGRLGLDPVLMAAANSGGGVMGKMISLQTIAVAAAATGMSVNDQARLFRFTLKHSVVLACLIGLLVVAYSAGFGAA
jgi:L-lactate transport